MSAVHLNVVELEGDGQSCLQPAFAVATPHHHRITELVGVLVDDAVEFGGRHRRRAYHHRTVHETALAGNTCRLRQNHVVGAELIQVIAIWNVA